jgi:hypothetical protein
VTSCDLATPRPIVRLVPASPALLLLVCLYLFLVVLLLLISLHTLGHPKDKARARTPEPEQRAYLGGSDLLRLILAAASAKYCSAGRLLISSDSIPKNKPIYQFAMKSKALCSWAQALNSIDLIGRLLSITRVPKLTC